MAEDAGEKKHQPTERRLQQAREKGQIRRSTDLPKAALTLLLVLAIVAIGSVLANALYMWLRACLEAASSGQTAPTRALAIHYAMALGGLLTVAMGLSILFGTLTGGWFFSIATMAPDLERISPSRSWGQIFSLSNFIEVLKSALKIAVIGGAGLLAFYGLRPSFLVLASSRSLSLAALSTPALLVVAASVAGAAALAGADVGVQIWMNRRTLRMTDRELRDEVRESQGDPHVRARRRSVMRRLARARQLQAVRTASVIITNPTHFAVALRYRRGVEPVPMVVAKGADLAATPLLTEARRYAVPLVEAPPLARALHRQVDVDQPVPPALYRAVAEVLAYVWRLDQWRASGGAWPRRPVFSETLDMPAPDDHAVD
jgi:flagellar biosynthesis protein FlhB